MDDALKAHEGILTINNDYDVAVYGGGIAGILRLGGAKIAVFWVTQQSAKWGKIARKTLKNAPKSMFRKTVQNLLKITKKCELPKSTRRQVNKKCNSCLFF